MSERMSYTSEYIYCEEDYKNLRARFEKEKASKYFNLADETKWSNGVNEFITPIIQGKICEMSESPWRWYIITDILSGFVTKYAVRFVIVNDASEGVTIITKEPNGNVKILRISEDKIIEESENLYD